MPISKVLRPNFDKRDGLVTVVTQDVQTHQILMVAYANEEAWLQTMRTRTATYYSTSRNRLWVKGEESGNTQRIVDVYVDCDGDALIYEVQQQGEGKACHTGAVSCFYRNIIEGKAADPAPNAGEKEALAVVEIDVHEAFL